jgi:hypothetical protein
MVLTSEEVGFRVTYRVADGIADDNSTIGQILKQVFFLLVTDTQLGAATPH